LEDNIEVGFKKYGEGVGGLIWLRLGVNVGLFVLHKMQEIYYPAQELHASLKMGYVLFV